MEAECANSSTAIAEGVLFLVQNHVQRAAEASEVQAGQGEAAASDDSVDGNTFEGLAPVLLGYSSRIQPNVVEVRAER